LKTFVAAFLSALALALAFAGAAINWASLGLRLPQYPRAAVRGK
jgi:hypothetical protein